MIDEPVTAGQAHDARSATDMLDGVGDGQTLLADRAYASDGLRTVMVERGASAKRPSRSRHATSPPCAARTRLVGALLLE